MSFVFHFIGKDQDVHLFPPREIIPGEDDHMNLAQDILDGQDNLFMDIVPPTIQDFVKFDEETKNDFDLADDAGDFMSRCSIQTEISDKSSQCMSIVENTHSNCDKTNINNHTRFDTNRDNIITNNNSSTIPAAAASKLSIEIVTKSPHIPLNMILNHCGSLLVRTGHNIRPSKMGGTFCKHLYQDVLGKLSPFSTLSQCFSHPYSGKILTCVFQLVYF